MPVAKRIEPLTAEQQNLAADNVRLAYHLANRLHGSVRTRLPLEDVQAAALLGLVKAAALFDPGRGWRFGTYAGHCIRGSVLDATLDAGVISLPSSVREQGGYQRSSPSVREAVDRARRPVRTGRPPEVQAPEAEPVEGLDLPELSSRLHDALAALPERQGLVVRLLFFAGLTLKQVGGRLGLSKERVRQIREDAVARLRREMGAEDGEGGE